MKKRKKHWIIAIVCVVLFSIAAVVYFHPKSLRDTLNLKGIHPEETSYCTIFDISEQHSENWAAPLSELLTQSDNCLGALLDHVMVSGPVFYKSSAKNPDQVNLFFSLPEGNDTYRRTTVELILSYDNHSDDYSAFINVNGSGYVVTSGKSDIAQFINTIRVGGK